MSFNKFIKIRVLFIAMILCLIANVGTAVAQEAASAASTTSEIVQDNSGVYKSAWYYVILFVLVCVLIGIIGKVLKVYELTSEIHGTQKKLNWNKIQGVLFIITLIVGLAATWWTYDVWGYVVTNESASEHGKSIDSMMMTTVVITTIVFVLTQILLFGFAFKYSSNDKRKAYFYPHNNAIERIWTIIPAIVLTILVLYGFTTWRKITNPSETDIKNALSIEITGEQFKWNVRYAGENNELGLRNYKLSSPTNNLGIDFTDPKSWDDRLGGEIVLPVNKAVRFTIRSKDVLHSFYIPEFKAQINAVPGMPTYFQLKPTLTTAEMREKKGDPEFNYTLLCAKICGAGHYNMQYVVKVVTEKEYAEWIVKQPLFFNDDMKAEMKMANDMKPVADNKLAIK